MRRHQALDDAIALARGPVRAAALRAAPFPPGVRLVLDILAGDARAIRRAEADYGIAAAVLVDLAENYVLQTMLYRGAPPRHILGLNPDDPRPTARDHMGALLKWVHPDRNPNPWQSAFVARVAEAWRLVDRGLADSDRLVPRRGTRIAWIPLSVEETPRARGAIRRWRLWLAPVILLVGLGVLKSLAENSGARRNPAVSKVGSQNHGLQ